MTKVLLVEDDNNLREIFEMRLQADGYQTLTASDGEEALVIAMREKPDLIVADVMMPKLSGFEMLETLRAAPEMKDVKVVMMTALGQAEDQARGERLGVIKYLVKSQVTLEDFARVISEILKPGPASPETDSDAKTEPENQNSATTNKVESEKSMPDDTTPTNPATPADQGAPTAPAADSGTNTNPISSPAPADSTASDQSSTAQEQNDVQSQINDFASSPAAAPAADTSAPADSAATTPGNDSGVGNIPVSQPPADDASASAPADSSASTESSNGSGVPPVAPTGV